MSTYAERQAYRDANPGVIVDANSAYNPKTGQEVSFTGGGGGGNGSLSVGSAPPPPVPAGDPNMAQASAALGKIANQMTQALATGNKAAFDEAVREYNQTFGLDQQKFQNSIAEFNRNFGLSEAGLTGTYNGAPTLAAQQQAASLSGMYNGAPTLEAQTQQQNTANQYLTLLSGLRGPANAFQYAKTLQGTPQGMTDIVNAAAGRYQLGGGPSGAMSAPASLNNLMADVNGANGANQIPNVSGLPQANQIDTRNYNQMLPSQKALLWGAYEYGGPTGAMVPEDAQAMYQQSMPKFAYKGGPGQVSLR